MFISRGESKGPRAKEGKYNSRGKQTTYVLRKITRIIKCLFLERLHGCKLTLQLCGIRLASREVYKMHNKIKNSNINLFTA